MVKLSYKNIIQYLLISSFAFLVGCDDETPFPTTFDGETAFLIDGQLDSDDLVLEAGKDNFYMYTDLELNADDILQFSGAFQKNDLCTDICNEKLKIIINNNQPGLSIALDTALYIGNYKLEPSIQVGNSEYDVNFTPFTNNLLPNSYFWDFGNGQVSSDANPTNTYTNDTTYVVKLEVGNLNGQKSIYIDSMVNFNAPAVDCGFNLDYDVIFDSIQNTYNYSMNVVDTTLLNPLSTDYSWSVNFPQGNNFTFNTQDSITFSVTSTANTFQVCVNKTSTSCNIDFCKDFENQLTTSYDLSFDYDVQTITTPGDSSFFSMVIIEYTTPDNIFYSSQLGSQTNSTFEILNILDHDNNEREQTTKKIEAAVNCKLYNQNGSSLNFISNELIFGVSTSN